jgi:uncharacterized protein YbjT (DUF2867 family)
MTDNALVIGSTGLVGRLLVNELTKKNISTIAVTRRPFENNYSSNSLLEVDFNSVLDNKKLPTCDHIYICLGSTIKKAGSQQAFRKVDFEYSLEFAKIAKNMGAKKISLVSSVGANCNSKNFYLRVKGELEEAIDNLDYDQINIYRPSLLIGSRDETRFLEKLGQNFSFLINLLLWGSLKKYRSINANRLATCIANTKNKIGTNYYYYEDY